MPDRRVARRLNFGLSPMTPQGAANILAAAAASARVTRSAYKAYKRKKPMSSIKKKAEKAVRRGQKNNAVAIGRRVGPFLGSIAATKPVKLVKGSTLYRKVTYDELGSTTGYAGGHSMWVGGSSLGSQGDNFKVVADAFICHYLKRVRDHRSSRTQTPHTDLVDRLWQHAKITFGRVGTDIDTAHTYELINADINTMATQLGSELKSQWIDHSRVPFKIVIKMADIKNHNFPDELYYRDILRDDFCQKAVFTFSSKANFKINNTTMAGTDGAGASNVNAVDANPIDGRIYTFRNRVPIFSPSYMENLSAAEKQQLQQISLIGDTNYGVQFGLLNVLNVPDSLHAPPLRPAVVFNNCKTSTKVAFAPGGYKMFTMSYGHEGTMNSLFKHIMKQEFYPGFTEGQPQRIVPPGADSFLMCLKPTIRTGGANDMALHTQAEFVYKVNMKAGKPAKLPTVQDIEA